MEKIIEIKKLSNSTVIFTDVEPNLLGIESGSGVIFIPVADLYNFTRALKKADQYFLKK